MHIQPKERYPFLVRFILWAQEKKYGQALLPAKIWGRSLPLALGVQFFYRIIDRRNSPIEPQLRSLIGVRVSQLNHCAFCHDIAQSLLQKRRIPLDKINAIEAYDSSPLFTDKEKIVLSYADRMTKSGQTVDQDLMARLKTHFSDDGIVELTALIAYQNFSSKFNAALNIPSQGFCQPPEKS